MELYCPRFTDTDIALKSYCVDMYNLLHTIYIIYIYVEYSAFIWYTYKCQVWAA